jgi:hypothetical protein
MVNPVLGGFLLLVGLVGAFRPYAVARFEEAIDAIGSKRRSSAVEPAEWKVTLTRVTGVGVTLFGLLVLLDI